MKNGNMNIIYVRAYNGGLIPIKNVNLVTVDPNKGNITQEIPMTVIMEKLMYHNMNDYIEPRDNWLQLDNYSIIQSEKK